MRSSSPRPNSSTPTSRTPTPSPTPNSKLNKKKFFHPVDSFFYEVSNDKFWFPVIIVLSIVFSIITLNMVPSFCSADGSQTSYRCQKCPDNSKCRALSFECEKNFSQINHNCVSEEQKKLYTPEISNLTEKISQLLDNNENIKDLNELCTKLNESPLEVRTAIEFTDYRITGDQELVEKIFYYPSAGGYWFFIVISHLITLFGLVTLAYHFLRYKNI